MIKTKRKGSRAEREVKAILEKHGFLCSKAGGSLGLWDIIAINKNGVKLIQVKSSEKSFHSASWQAERKRMGNAEISIPRSCNQEFWIRRWGGAFENWGLIEVKSVGRVWVRCPDIIAGAIIE